MQPNGTCKKAKKRKKNTLKRVTTLELFLTQAKTRNLLLLLESRNAIEIVSCIFAALQKIRQASLLDELREACEANKKEDCRETSAVARVACCCGHDNSSSTAVVPVNHAAANSDQVASKFLTSIAESQDPPKLPPAFILNLVKGKERRKVS